MTAVLVARRFDNFSRILTQNSLAAINCPTIETRECENSRELAAKFLAKNYDGIFLTSPQATAIAWREIFCKNFNYRGKIYILGKSSFDLLRDKNLAPVFDASANTAREMLERIPLADLAGKRFLFIRGERSLGVIADFLSNIATLDEEIVYRTQKVAVPDDLRDAIAARAARGEISAACFFSPSGAESFLEQFEPRVLHQMKIATIGKTTAAFLEKQNLKADLISSTAAAEDFAAELIDYLRRINRPRSDAN
jgi:uroporphyrinogen-III synthase